ncbi:hypothetical protein PINS_up014119 [Pythium insidiosum]|nr:hypothetical protein PINS_up014119 [Pythium insidiosum]
MLLRCPNWLAFVEGISELRSWRSSAGTTYYFEDWWGGGLSKAQRFPVRLPGDKLVYAPHYYTPAVYPADYFYGPNQAELPDAALKENVIGTFDSMFGYLSSAAPNQAMVLGEFGGLYTTDRHPAKTIQRVLRYTVDLMLQRRFAGGYVWSLNPESGYGYNPGKTEGFFQEGLVSLDWRSANEPYLAALQAMDSLPDLKPLRCFTSSSP